MDDQLLKMHKEISSKAAKHANEAMREQFLVGGNAPDAFANRLAALKKRNATIMSHQWSPFIGHGGKDGLGLKLRPGDEMLLMDIGEIMIEESDKGYMSLPFEGGQIFEFATEMKPTERIQQIASDAIVKAIVEDRRTKQMFVKTLMHDLMSGDPFHKHVPKGDIPRAKLSLRRSGN